MTLKERGHCLNLLIAGSLVVQAQQVRVLLLARLFLRMVKESNGDEESHACMIDHMVGRARRARYLAWRITFLARSSCSPVRHTTWKSVDISRTSSIEREVCRFCLASGMRTGKRCRAHNEQMTSSLAPVKLLRKGEAMLLLHGLFALQRELMFVFHLRGISTVARDGQYIGAFTARQ